MQNENLENQSNQVKKNPIEKDKSIRATTIPEKDVTGRSPEQGRKEVNLNRGADAPRERSEDRKFDSGAIIKEGIDKAKDTYERVKEKGLGGFDKGKLS